MENNNDIFLEEQLEFRIQKAMSEQMDNVIDKVIKIAKKFSIANQNEKSPFRNVLSVATESGSSVEVVKNFIKYQVGRKGSSDIWKLKKEQELFAAAVISDIEILLNEDTEEIIEKLRKNIEKNNSLNSYVDNPSNQKELKRKIHLKLTQLYLGYLAREHTALVGEKELTKIESSK
ncbi:MAG: hypothetical protein QNJ51_19340 [Calothrix sp. MO_167.B12]|nr:hypothetical protein [Calothrix sp. MO_167.B12]